MDVINILITYVIINKFNPWETNAIDDLHLHIDCIIFMCMITGHLATREFRHQPTRRQETISPPSKVYSPPNKINKNESKVCRGELAACGVLLLDYWWRVDFAWWRDGWWRDGVLVASWLVAKLPGGEMTGYLLTKDKNRMLKWWGTHNKNTSFTSRNYLT